MPRSSKLTVPFVATVAALLWSLPLSFTAQADSGACKTYRGLSLPQIAGQIEALPEYDPTNEKTTCLIQMGLVQKNLLSPEDVTGGIIENPTCQIMVQVLRDNGLHDVKDCSYTEIEPYRAFLAQAFMTDDNDDPCAPDGQGGVRDAQRCAMSMRSTIVVEDTQQPSPQDDQLAKLIEEETGREADATSKANLRTSDKVALATQQMGPGGEAEQKAPAQVAGVRQTVTTKVATTASGCDDPSRERDPDIARNLNTIRKAGLCFKKVVLSEGKYRWVFEVFSHPSHKGPFWVVPHDDENAAFDAAVYATARYGGGFLAVEAGERRIFRGQDPNRNFGTTRTTAKRCRDQRAPAPKFTATIFRIVKAHKAAGAPYMALHTNDNGLAGYGGTGTISVRRQSRVLKGFPSGAKGGLGDEDSVVLIAGRSEYNKNRSAQKTVRGLNKLGLNVIYEHVTKRGNDCSYSNYILLRQPASYFNIEVQHGALGVQKKMIRLLLERYLGIRPLSKTARHSKK